MDCLLLHVPKFSSVYAPLGEFMNITYMPMGLPAIANWLERNGVSTEIIHLGVEWIKDPKHSTVEEISNMDVSLIGMALYWHYQTFDVLDVAERIKAAKPEAFIFLGGITAAYFARDILAEYPFVDAVIVGDGEISAVELAEAHAGKREMSDVANLVYRRADGEIISNTRRVASDQDMIDQLTFGDLSMVRNADIYVDRFGFPLAYPKQFSAGRNDATQKLGKRSFFPLFTGRGCAWECTFCGGNRAVLGDLTATAKLRFRNYSRVVDDIELALGHGYRTMALCFDPTPDRDDYYVDMFREIRRRKLDVDFYFECWGLPTRRFLTEWVETFGHNNEHSYLALSPDAGNEEVRRKNKQPFYTDEEFFKSMDDLEEFGITADIFFTTALPYENVHTALDANKMIRRIRDNYTISKRIMIWSVQLEPGSPQYERPEMFNMETDRKSVVDFYNLHGGGKGGGDTYSSLGYKILDYFGDARDQGSIQDFEANIQGLKCMEFCFYGEDATKPSQPADGRRWCLGRRNEIAASVGLGEQTEISRSYPYAKAARALAPAFPKTRPRYA
ncbi:MAG: radical SAM superfamily enzyme YgiQ (UPF0313 family) [Hyphomicrobiaceae bacterium]|jgi:radical SAM superfamily enzyme YgiQ (UPF0313 family)